MKITFWGTRGSIPVPGRHTAKVGGNTTCLEVTSNNGTRIIVDAGTGIRELGNAIEKDQNSKEIILLLTHSHWDHLAGYAFFAPAYDPAFSIVVYGNRMAQEVLRNDIYKRHDNRYFPVNTNDLKAAIEFHEDIQFPQIIRDFNISTLNLNHPGNGFAYRFEQNGKKVAFITDNELGLQYEGGNTQEEIESFCQGVDLLIHDGQFLPAEIENHRAWGHSTYAEVVDLARKIGLEHIILTHHAPERNDKACEALLKDARNYIKDKGCRIKCELAIEGQVITI